MKRMRIRLSIAGVLLLLGVLAVFRYATYPNWGTYNCAITSVGGREVVVRPANLLSSVHLTSNNKSSEILVGGRSVRVSADTAEIVGLRNVQLPEACKKLEVIETRHGIRILLDGVIAN